MPKYIPNVLTIMRLVLSLPILVLLSFVQTHPKIHLVVVLLVVAAALTDWFDGWYARKFDCISDFGKIHDPLADKWLAALYVPMVALGMIHFLPVAILWIRDITSTSLRNTSDKVIGARLSGKIKTAISFPLLCLLIAAIPIEGSYFGLFTFFAGFLYLVGGTILSVVCIWSGIDYYINITKEKQ